MNDVTIKAVVVTVSDTRNIANDLSGATLADLLSEIGAEIVDKIIVSDDFEDLRNALYILTEREEVNLIITTGGTGFAPRDNTPEATRAVIEREAPGIAEAMRSETAKYSPSAMLSRAICGIRGGKLIVNFPGSPKAVGECFEVIREVLPHAINLISGKTKHEE